MVSCSFETHINLHIRNVFFRIRYDFKSGFYATWNTFGQHCYIMCTLIELRLLNLIHFFNKVFLKYILTFVQIEIRPEYHFSMIVHFLPCLQHYYYIDRFCDNV